MEIDKESGMWDIAQSYARDEARALGMRRGYMPMYRYVIRRAPEIYEALLNKTYQFASDKQ